MIKRIGKRKWLSLLLVVFSLTMVPGCGKNNLREGSELSGSVDNPNTRYAKLMGVNSFKETFKPRGRMTDQSGSPESSEEESAVSLIVKNVDGDANVFYYIDATGKVDLEDLGKDDYIPGFQKQLNENSNTYQYSKMELLDRGANYYEFKVSIEDKDTQEALSSEEETASEKNTGSKKGTTSKTDSSSGKETAVKKDTGSKDESTSKKDTASKNESTSKKDSDSKDESVSKNNTDSKDKATSKKESVSKSESTVTDETASEKDSSSEEEAAGEQVEKESKPMLFMYIEKGKKTYEIIGLDMEAESSAAFSESFQGILDEIVTIKEVSAEKDA